MGKNGPEYGSSESLNDVIEKTSDKRAEYTRNFLAKKGVSPNDFVENLKKAPWNITIDVADNKSWALGVVEIQKKLGFPQIDSPTGCDGRLGPFTWRSFQVFGLGKKSKADRTKLLGEVQPKQNGVPIGKEAPPVPQESPAPEESPTPKVETAQPEKGKQSAEVGDKVPLSQTIFIGDSITAGMAFSKSINGAKECFKGGMQSGWMLKNFRERFFDKDDKGKYTLKPEYQNGAIKKIVVEGGFNDITSVKSVESVKKNLTEIYQLARENGLTIVAPTYFDWDAQKGVELFQRTFKKHGWGEYPLSAEELQKRIGELNQWVLSQNDPANGFIAVDLTSEMSDHQKYPRGDFVHPAPKGSKAMAKYIKEHGGIVDEEAAVA